MLFESASGYALFERVQSEEIGAKLEQVQKNVSDLAKFGQTVKLKSFSPFKSAADALENANDVSEGKSTMTKKKLFDKRAFMCQN